ncbi:hypothetical protein [Streptomyces sp. NPDC090025]|uniref:hypothetical protein n=1 Tax=Streptomyces sp. NPDC090025 TaxID=3365922 RepID=UPI0038334EC3
MSTLTTPRARLRVRAGAGALLAAVVLALLPLPGTEGDRAEAAAPAPERSSAVTKNGTKGPYDDFSRLKVTVHQTRDLRSQGVRVTWTDGAPTELRNNNYLQIFQCWGDDPAGPAREQCQYGAAATGSDFGAYVDRRLIPVGSDPLEKQYDKKIPDPQVPGLELDPFVPFKPVKGPQTRSLTDWTYFGPGDTNEQFFANTQPDGTGQAVVSLQTTREAPHLGCGDPLTGPGGTVRGRSCWLVVVPRGVHDPDGTTGNSYRPVSSALSATNWAQRIVFPLDFLPVRDACATDKSERRMTGSELVTDAVTSWQAALCAGGSSRFTFTQRGEDLARRAIEQPTSTSPGLAFTVKPVEGVQTAVHAPVAVSGLTVGFFWEADRIGRVGDLKLSPRLLAKMLTYSYPYDIRQLTFNRPAPDHVKANPLSIVKDPEFLQLNPEFARNPQAPQIYPGGILFSAERSDVNGIVWKYLRSDKDARAFLEGKADPWGMKINPYYEDLNLAKEGPDEFPKADPTETEVNLAEKKMNYSVTDRSPYALDMHDAAQLVRRGSNGGKFNPADDPTSDTGIKLVAQDVIPGSRAAYGITDNGSAQRYQLETAALPNAAGEYVKPTTATLLDAVGDFREGPVRGVLDSDPSRVGRGGYPLTVVTYAAASTDLAAADRKEYARVLRYAGGAGQRQGTAPGELPYGYAPLPQKLRLQAVAAASRLEQGTPASTTGGTATGGSGTSGASGGSGGTDGGAGGSASGGSGSIGGATGGTGGTTGGAAGATTGGPTGGGTASGGSAGPDKGLAGTGITSSEALGVIRWVLLTVLVVGGGAAIAGPVLLRLSVLRPRG